MFSTSKNMNKIQIGIHKKDKVNWSQPISLQATEGVFQIKDKFQSKDKLEMRHLHEIGITIESGSGFWNRSKIIYLTPRYVVRNESSFSITL